MNIDLLIKSCFPFPKFNPGQFEAVKQAVEHIRAGKKHVVISAPTGVGKSALATTIHAVLLKLDQYHRTTLITGTKGLQDQYVKDSPEIYDLKGKGNYDCVISKSDSHKYMSSGCIAARAADKCSTSVCPYVMRRNHWLKRAAIRLTNSSFIITAPADMVASDVSRTKLMIVDECHELANHLISHATLRIDIDSTKTTNKVYGESYTNSVKDFIGTIGKVKVGSAFKPIDIDTHHTFGILYNKIGNVLEAVEDRMERGDNTPTLPLIYDELSEITGNLTGFVAQRKGEWILTEYERGKSCELKPVYAHQVANRGIFTKADQFIHMSATICGFKEYCRNLGIDINDAVYISVDNPIPIENRQVHIQTEINVNRNVDHRALAKHIDAIIENESGNGVIHTVSFSLAESILQYSKHRARMMISNKRTEILKLLGGSKNAIVLSPSVETGYDFKGDLARWQIIAKVPFGYIGDPFVKLNMTRDSSWYSRQAILRLVQASGRVSRGVDDFGTTYIVDSNAIRLITNNTDVFPDWYIDALVIE